MPFKSSFGNIMTSKVMKLLVGIAVSDTQTGLRAMSKDLMEKFLKVTVIAVVLVMSVYLLWKQF